MFQGVVKYIEQLTNDVLLALNSLKSPLVMCERCPVNLLHTDLRRISVHRNAPIVECLRGGGLKKNDASRM